MGAGIAAHLANVGIPVLLLDIVPPDATESKDRAARNRIAAAGLERALKAKPASAFYVPRSGAARHRRQHRGRLRQTRRGRLDRRGGLRAAGRQARHLTARSSRCAARAPSSPPTPPASRRAHADGGTRRRLPAPLPDHPLLQPGALPQAAGTGAGPADRPRADAFMGAVRHREAGQGRRLRKDTPNFIGNRIGSYGFLVTLRRMLDEGYTIEEVDAIFGPVAGPRQAPPPSAPPTSPAWTPACTSPTTSTRTCPTTRSARSSSMPDFVREMVKRGWTGDKGGQGFYKRVRGAEGQTRSSCIDPATLEYRPQEQGASSPRLAPHATTPTSPSAFAIVLDSDDRAGKLAWEVTADALLYTAATTPGDRRRHRQHRPRDALGLQLGARPLRELGRAGRRRRRRSA